VKDWVLITGAGGGIGRAAALRLAADGFAVCATDVDETALRQTETLVREAGGEADMAVMDISRADQVDAVVNSRPQWAGLVNNAGVYWTKPFDEISTDDFERQFAVNVTAMFAVSKAVVARMGGRGRIVNLSSRAALGGRNNTHYASAKAAILGLTKSMALELAPRGITVNAVAPGVILTDMLRKRGDDLAVLAAEQPVGRLGAVEDVAHAISFFLDPRADFITGQVLLVDGGRSIGGANPF